MAMMKEKRIVGYTDRISAAPGETVRFMVSCYGVARYRADIVRLISGDLHPDGAGFKEQVIETAAGGEYAGREQVIHGGSHGVIDDGAPFAALSSFTLQAMIWPTTPARGRQVLLGKWSERDQCGYALVIGEDGGLALMLGDGAGNVETVSAGKPLQERKWCFAGASFDAETGAVRLYQEPLVDYPLADSAAAVEGTVAARAPGQTDAPFMIAAAYGGEANGRAGGTRHYNGKIDSPAGRQPGARPRRHERAAAPADPGGAAAGGRRRLGLRAGHSDGAHRGRVALPLRRGARQSADAGGDGPQLDRRGDELA